MSVCNHGEAGMARLIGLFGSALMAMIGTALASAAPVGVPLPQPGTAGPIGIVAAAAAYLCYRAYRHFARPGQ